MNSILRGIVGLVVFIGSYLISFVVLGLLGIDPKEYAGYLSFFIRMSFLILFGKK